MRTSHRITALTAAILVVLQGVAMAAWIATGTGVGGAHALSVPRANAPSGSVSGRNVTVTWPEVSLTTGAAADGYTVTRYSSAGTAEIVKASCAGTQTGLSCTENAVPPGSWTYTVSAKRALWVGAESDRSTAVSVGAP